MIKIDKKGRIVMWLMKKAAPHVAVATLKATKEMMNEGIDEAIKVLQEEKTIEKFIENLGKEAKETPKTQPPKEKVNY